MPSQQSDDHRLMQFVFVVGDDATVFIYLFTLCDAN